MNVEDIKVVTKEVDYNTIINIVNYIVDKSFVNGTYHQYLFENAETASVLVTFTNYKPENENGDITIDEVMKIRHSTKWFNIIEELGYVYDDIHRYAKGEVERMNQPLARLDELLEITVELVYRINDIIKNVDFEKLAQADFSGVIDAVNALEAKIQEEKKTEE